MKRAAWLMAALLPVAGLPVASLPLAGQTASGDVNAAPKGLTNAKVDTRSAASGLEKSSMRC